jgi:hypothetical protein
MSFRTSERNRERKCRLSTPDITTQDGEVATPKPTAEAAIEARESRSHGVGVRRALGNRIDLSEECRE